MHSELYDLYQQVILDHNKSPRNFGIVEPHNHSAVGHNPFCGDHIDIYLNLDNGIIKEISFNGSGCAISKASASIMTTVLKGKSIEEARKLFNDFHEVVTSDPTQELDTSSFGKLSVFVGVREFPARIKCASLAWHTMSNALENKNQTSTE